MLYLKEILLYSKEWPLLFTHSYFWVFFALVLFFYSFLYKRKTARHFYLFAVSLFFYYKTSGFYFSLLIFSTLVDFFIGKYIYKSNTKWKRVALLSTSIFVNLFVLSYFKYSYLFVDTINYVFDTQYAVVDVFAKWMNQFSGTHFDIDKIILPVGISFFTFQTISYSVDVYKGKVEPVKNITDFGFYVSFFPQLVAGPIVRANEFIPQLYKDYKVSMEEFGLALFLVLKGMFKKVVLGDYIAVNFIDRIFGNPEAYTGMENLFALYGYSLQVYADFSGYTDIAIGVALLLGFRLPVNFNSPYKAFHVGDFWKRWHISLSTWLKDYLYIPLGGNRSASVFSYLFSVFCVAISLFHGSFDARVYIIFMIVLVAWVAWLLFKNGFYAFISISLKLYLIYYIYETNWIGAVVLGLTTFCWLVILFFPKTKLNIINHVNLMITMLLGGLWHGASWQFVLWGGLNGLGLVVYKIWSKLSPFKNNNKMYARFVSIFITFNFISFTRIWFRSESMANANSMLSQLFSNFRIDLFLEILSSYRFPIAAIAIGYIIHWLPTKIKGGYQYFFIKTPLWVKLIVTVVSVFVIYQAKSADFQPFIYFQF